LADFFSLAHGTDVADQAWRDAATFDEDQKLYFIQGYIPPKP
jgi:hypothetical protein